MYIYIYICLKINSMCVRGFNIHICNMHTIKVFFNIFLNKINKNYW